MIRTPILIIAFLVLVLGAVSCAETSTQPPAQKYIPPEYPQASMTADEIINIVQVYGVPAIPHGAVPMGKWSAYYEGNGRWKVRGQVRLNYPSGNYDYSITWLYDGRNVSATEVVQISSPTPQALIPKYKPTTPIPTYQAPVRSSMRDFYLNQAESYQRQAQNALDRAQSYQRSMEANPSYHYFRIQYEDAMKYYNHYQQLANEYLFKAMREP